MNLTVEQKKIVDQAGHVLVTGGPGSGKTTVAILKAARIADSLPDSRFILFLSFARATVARILEAMEEEKSLPASTRSRIEVDTYHSFFWQILKTHGYLAGLPRRLSLLLPPAAAIALSSIRNGYKSDAKLNDQEMAEKKKRVSDELDRLAFEEGRVCFDLFGPLVSTLLNRSKKVRALVSNAYPTVILDEFQDTNSDQWEIVKAVGDGSVLIALADPEQRIFDFIGADPARLGQFKGVFTPTVFDLAKDNHRSQGTDIADFGNDILMGRFSKGAYTDVGVTVFDPNQAVAFNCLRSEILSARKRLIASGPKGWTLAVLVPTKRMTRFVSDNLREPLGRFPAIPHTAAIDTEPTILAAEVIAYLLQNRSADHAFAGLVDLVCNFYRGKGGDAPKKADMTCADAIRAAWDKALQRELQGKPMGERSIVLPMLNTWNDICSDILDGDPDKDWAVIRLHLERSKCSRLQEISHESRNIRLLDRGTELRQALSQDWRATGTYQNALTIVRNAFVQEHFSTSKKPERGVIVMNMHKAKGKQFDEVIIFEGWPIYKRRQIVSNPDRIVRGNQRLAGNALSQARQNLRVSITRAKKRTTILTPRSDPCVLLA